jgi:hypothetical protein
MRRLALALGLLAMAGSGCATSGEIERKAQRHEARADRAASMRDYQRAAKEQREAERLHQKAAAKAYEEGEPPPVTPAPSPSVVVPPPAAPLPPPAEPGEMR